VSDATSIRRIGQDGSIAWQYDAGQFNTDYSRILLGPDQTVYYSTGTSVVSLAQPIASGGNGILLVLLVAIDLIVLGLYGRKVWMEQRTRKERELATLNKKKKQNKK
jgi:hypothetical protein